MLLTADKMLRRAQRGIETKNTGYNMEIQTENIMDSRADKFELSLGKVILSAGLIRGGQTKYPSGNTIIYRNYVYS